MRRIARLCLLIGIGVAIPYVAFCGLLMRYERNMLYRPSPGPETPEESGLTGFTRRAEPQGATSQGIKPQGAQPQSTQLQGTALGSIQSQGSKPQADEHRSAEHPAHPAPLVYWERPTAAGPIVLFFHGNGGGLHAHASALHQLAGYGLHVAALQYPGYPGAPGEPSEPLITAHAIALYDLVRRAHPDRPIAVWGFSLGSAVAVQLAARRPTVAVILEAPPSSVVDHTAQRMPYVPIRLLMRDQWRSRDVIAAINAPLVILHGETDGAVPIRHGETLLAHAREPKSMHRFPGFGHNDLGLSQAYDVGVAFLRQSITGQPR